MATNFLEQLRSETKENYLSLIQTNRTLFYEKLIENWCKETIARIQNSILYQVKNGDYTICGKEKRVVGTCSTSISILTGIAEEFRYSNSFLKKEIEEQRLTTFFHPIFVATGKHSVDKKYGSGFFNTDYITYNYQDYTIKLPDQTKKVIQKIESMAKLEGISLHKIGFSGYNTTVWMFDSLYETKKTCSALIDSDTGRSDYDYHKDHFDFFKNLHFEYSVIY